MGGNTVLPFSSTFPFRSILCRSFMHVAFTIALAYPVLSYKTAHALPPLLSTHPPTPEFQTSHHSWRCCIMTQYNCSSSSGFMFGFLTLTPLTDNLLSKWYPWLSYSLYYSRLPLLYCGRVPAANAPGCIAAEGLFYKPWSLVVPTCTARCLHQRP